MTPLAGAAAGAAGAAAILSVLALSEDAGAGRAGSAEIIGRAVLQVLGQAAPSGRSMWVGVAAVVGVSVVCGLLYASAQRAAPPTAIFSVGIFYGVMLWVVGSIVAGWLLGGLVRESVRTWPWLVALEVYALVLSLAALRAQRRLTVPRAEPVD